MTRIFALVAVACFAAALLPSEANAQRRYQPPIPTVSRYQDLFRQDTGLLDPYNTFVAPRQRATQELGQQFNRLQNNIERQQGQLDRLNQQLESGASPTGKGGGFMNYSHYFGESSSGQNSSSDASAARKRASAGIRSGGGGRSSGGSYRR